METPFTRSIYNRSPLLLRSMASSAFGWLKNRRRYKGDFDHWYGFFDEAASWSVDRLYAYQSERLQHLVASAFDGVPYYQEKFRKLGIEASDLRLPEDLEQLPILEKADIASRPDAFVHSGEPLGPMKYYPTSGSTGTPLIVPRADTIEQLEWAFLRSRFWPRNSIGKPYSSFSGLELLPPERAHPPFWIDNWANSQRMYSIFHMSEANLAHYVASLQNRYSYYYVGYPSAIFLVCDYMIRHGISLKRPPRYVISSSEELQPHYEKTIRKALGADIRNRYGQNELVGSITSYDCGHMHYDMDYSILEFLPLDRKAAASTEADQQEPGEVVAEILGTNMHDLAWPLLRYRTGDLVVYHPDDRCEAGRPGRIIRRVYGRAGRFFTLPSGSRVTNISVIAKKCSRVRLMQVVQFEPGAIDIRIVRDDGFETRDAEKIVQEFQKKVGKDLQMNLVYVDDIERTSSGKYISIVNHIDCIAPCGESA